MVARTPMSPKTPHGHPRAAAAWMLLAGLLFAIMDAAIKWIADSYSPFQVAALRSIAAMPLVLLWIILRGRVGTLLHIYWPLHLARGVIGLGVMVCFIYGVARMPLSTAYAIVFVAPLMITALSVPLLGERVGPRRWTAIFVGLAGVLVVLRPGAAGVATGPGLVLLVSALCYAFAAITVRKLAQRDSPEAMVFWFLLLLGLFAGTVAAFDWRPVQHDHLAAIAVIGVTGAVAQIALTHAFRLGEASQMAPLEYAGLVWVVLLDFFIWHALPDRVTWLGAAIIVGSGIYLVHRDSVVAASARPPGEIV
jgi:drug/metabolite transporter (DMT)-like permease